MIRRAVLLLGLIAVPAAAQDHAGHHMPGMAMPVAKPQPKATPKPAAKVGPPKRKVVAPARKPTLKPTAPIADHAGHDMAMPATPAEPGAAATHDHSMMDQGAHAMPAMQPTGTTLPAGNALAPKAPHDNYADRQFSPAEMARARDIMMRENGGQTFATLMLNIAEYQARQGRDGYYWDAEGWFGGDINRLTIKSEGEGDRRLESAEVQALYSRAIGPYFNLQAGVRHDIKPSPSRTYAVVGFEGLAPYWFEVEGAAFLSDTGDLFARLEGYYDQRLTQRLVLQPRAELNFSAQNVPASGVGAGLSVAELGLRLRYEITRQFAPYIGINYKAKTDRTARYARAVGDDPTTTSLVAGIRLWF